MSLETNKRVKIALIIKGVGHLQVMWQTHWAIWGVDRKTGNHNCKQSQIFLFSHET